MDAVLLYIHKHNNPLMNMHQDYPISFQQCQPDEIPGL